MAVLDLFSLAGQVSDCVCAALRAERADGISWEGTCCVWPGAAVAFESCCEDGGQAWVVVQSADPTTTFPQADPTGLSGCRSMHTLAVKMEVGVLRCVCADDCDCDAKEESAAAVLSDLQAVLTGLQCCFGDGNGPCSGSDWRLLNFSLIGPDGGCAGSRFAIVVEAPMPCCQTP